MGTNYYLTSEPCAHCGSCLDRLHIGKSSGGWCFSLHVIPELGINNLDDWRKQWSKPGAKIINEYEDHIPSEVMEVTILKREWKRSELSPRWYQLNQAEPGPNGLVRHKIDPAGRFCIGHGDGPYDLCPGEFA